MREERETEVSDPEEMERILAALGFDRRFRYEKRREEWSFEGCASPSTKRRSEHFVEDRGRPAAIRRALQRLGLDFSEAVPVHLRRALPRAGDGRPDAAGGHGLSRSLTRDRSGPIEGDAPRRRPRASASGRSPDAIPKPLFPFLNVPLVRAHLRPSRDAGSRRSRGQSPSPRRRDRAPSARSAGGALRSCASSRSPRSSEPPGALANAADWLSRRRLPRRQLRRRDRARLRRAPRPPPRDGTRRDAPRHGEPGPGALHAASAEGDRISRSASSRPGRSSTRASAFSRRAFSPASRPASVARRRPLAAAPRRGARRDRLAPPRGPVRRSRPPARFPPRVARSADARRTVPRRGGGVRPPTRGSLPLERSGGFDAVRASSAAPSIGAERGLIESAVWDGVEIGAGARARRLHRGRADGSRPEPTIATPFSGAAPARRRGLSARLLAGTRSASSLPPASSLPASSRASGSSRSGRRRARRPSGRVRPRGRPSPACSPRSARRSRCRSC